jgi:hypothetical protein
MKHIIYRGKIKKNKKLLVSENCTKYRASCLWPSNKIINVMWN